MDAPKTPFDPAQDGARMSFSEEMSYTDYLGLDTLLTSQHPRSNAHDELLFIVQHQTSELWMRLAVHELEAARNSIGSGSMPPAFKMLARVARIFEQLNSAWDVLRTMTPSEYTTFREDLGASSGFQSHQYRLIEYILGNRNTALLKVHEHRADLLEILEGELCKPSLYQVVVAELAVALGEPIPDPAPARTPCKSRPEVQAMWRVIYEDPQAHWPLYELAEKLVDLEDYFRRWRFNHVTTVERVIGFKRGTGGTSGVSYLRRMLEVELFPELWHVRGEL
ncbi:MAG: tryptophan 2,3-dioxygenase family protein [Pseudomonadota bacterium]